jgi:hypothetical protein
MTFEHNKYPHMKDLFLKRFSYYKKLGDDTFSQLSEEQLLWQYNSESNSITTIVKHISGNMNSRWTDFLNSDGEKSWRNRDTEFENDIKTKQEILEIWEKAWSVFFDALHLINDENLYTKIKIRGEEHTVLDAILRQLAHYPYHIGQIVYVAKMLKKEAWQTLSIAKNKSQDYNLEQLKNSDLQNRPQNSSPVCFANSTEVRDDFKS